MRDGPDNGCYYHLEGASRWVGSEVQASFDWFHDGRVGTLIGVDGRLRDVATTRQDYDDVVTGAAAQAARNYGYFQQALGAYLEQTWRPTGWLSLNAGARVDVDSQFGAHVSPRAAVAASPWKGGSLKVVYSEAFRARPPTRSTRPTG